MNHTERSEWISLSDILPICIKIFEQVMMLAGFVLSVCDHGDVIFFDVLAVSLPIHHLMLSFLLILIKRLFHINLRILLLIEEVHKLVRHILRTYILDHDLMLLPEVLIVDVIVLLQLI